MFSRLTQGVTSVLQELSGEEHCVGDADSQDGLVQHSFPGPDAFSDVSGTSEEILERLAQTEQLVVHLKELIRERDNQLACAEKQLKEEKEQGDAKFTKLKLQAKAKMAVLNKQIAELKGQEGLNTSQSSESSLKSSLSLEEKLDDLKEKLSQEKASNQSLREQLLVLEERIKVKEEEHAEQVQVLQAVVQNKDVRFQEQIQKHEEELLQVKTDLNYADLQQALRDSQRRIEELKESLRSQSEGLDMLQQELNSADQQKQILTAQFRQMEQQLEEAQKLKEQEKQQSTLHVEEQRQALRSNLEALEKEKERHITAIEAELFQRISELDQVKASLDESVSKGQDKDLELITMRANLEVSEKQREELIKNLEVEVERRAVELHQLQRDAVKKEKEEASQRDREDLTRLQTELMSLRKKLKEQEGKVRAKQALEMLWKRLYSLSSEEYELEIDVPEDPLQILCALETRLDNLESERAKQQEKEVWMSQISGTIETLQGQLDKSTTEGEEATKIQHPEQQLLLYQVTDEPQEDQVTDILVGDFDKAEAKYKNKTSSEKILMLEHQLVEQEKELAALREQLAFTELHNLKEENSQEENSEMQNIENISITPDCSEVLPGLLDNPDEDRTLVSMDAETSSMSMFILSSSAGNESSPDTTGPKSESILELKGTSSDEMVTSTDSEVAHSSWTILEAFSQDACQEWPQQIQDLNAFHLSTQSWEETSEEQVTSTCSLLTVESSSMIVQEKVEIQIRQQNLNVQNVDPNPGQAFAQILPEELQMKYSELLSDLQQIKDSAAESQEKIHLLEEELKSLKVVKDEAEARALIYEKELVKAQAEIHQTEEQNTSDIYIQKNVLEEQLESMHEKANFKDQKICLLQADLEEIQQNLTKKEGHTQMLSSQLEDRELVSSELEEKVLAMEGRIQQISEETKKTKSALLGKSSELDDLQRCLTLKEQEIVELSNSMTAKLRQEGEEKFELFCEIKMLKEQLMELKRTRNDQQKVNTDKTAEASEDLVALQKENENLIAQVTTMKTEGEKVKQKLQAALVQRKQLIKKIGGFTREEESLTINSEGDVTSGDKEQNQELQKLESQLQETKQVLHSKQEALYVLEQTTLSQEQALAESHVEIQRLLEEAKELCKHKQLLDEVQVENSRLQLQVTNMESDSDVLQKKLQDAVNSRKVTLHKAKEKDRHHREQLRQLKDEYNGVLECFKTKEEEKVELIKRVKELESLVESRETLIKDKLLGVVEQGTEDLQKPGSGDWVQEDWVEFATADTEMSQHESPAEQPPQDTLEKVRSEPAACVDIEIQLQECQASLSIKETELLELNKELDVLRSKEKQIDALSEELNALRRKCEQAEAHAIMLKAELEEASVESPVIALHAEVDEFKQFLKSKNEEIIDLSQQLSEQCFLLQKMQETVLEKDQMIASLEEGWKAEQEKRLKLESERQQKQEEGKENGAKLQQLQRKLQAALVSRKEALKENNTLKEALANAEKLKSELLAKILTIEADLINLSTEKIKLIEEVDRTLLENQSLGASCESLKLAMDSLLTEKEKYKLKADCAKEETKQESKRWAEKLQGMKEEYETLLKSYENVSDEAERVRRVLEAARQERKESAAKARAHETAKQEAEKAAEEAKKEVDTIKEKMRKFAKTKQQKIMELEEENEKLRELVERKATKEPDTELKQDLKKVKNEFEALKANFNLVEAERKSLEQETEKLKQHLAQEIDKKNNEIPDGFRWNAPMKVKEYVVVQNLSPVLNEKQEDQVPGSFSRECHILEQDKEATIKKIESKLKVREAAYEVAEGKLKELQAALEDEKRLRVKEETLLNAELYSLRQHLQETVKQEEKLKEECLKKDIQIQGTQTIIEGDQEALLKAELSSFKQHFQDSEVREQKLKDECSRKENQLSELCTILEIEKDDLEERLMNQLAQVNGSIAGYQQEAADSRNRLTELQRELEVVLREKSELNAVLAGERDLVARLEEDKRQAQRERAEADADASKQRELEQKLKSAQRVREGSKSRARQLEELLREKQLVVRQMQKDCIQYQERISVLEREAKAQLLVRDELSNELEAAHQKIAKIKEEKSKFESELSKYKQKLDMAQAEVSQALAEKMASEQLLYRQEAELKSEAEQTLDKVRYRLGAELKQMELRLEQAYKDREREEEATIVAKNIADSAEKYAQETQTRLDESLARLAAFSRSMSSLQDDRDRVMDEAKQWEIRFHSVLQGKEAELRESENKAKELSERLKKETIQKELLQSTLERLQKAEEQWQFELSDTKKKHNESLAAVKNERNELQKKLAKTESSFVHAQSQFTSLEVEVEDLRHRSKALEQAVDKLQTDANKSSAELKEREMEERRFCLHFEQLETDLRSSKNLTETLQAELTEKQNREVELLEEKEHAVMQAMEEARKDANSRAEKAERQLEERGAAICDFEEKLRKTDEDARQSKTQLDTFTKAMGSLQDDRDRVLSQYKQLEERHLQFMMEKDSLIQEAATENNGLKEELRALLVQRDDLHAENAKLDAQLHGYRDELNQVLSMKDFQHKKLLSVQLERNSALENEREEFLAKIKLMEKEAIVKRGQGVEHEILRQSRIVETVLHDSPGAEVEKLREQLQEARRRITILEETQAVEKEAYAAHHKELNELRWEGGILRTETETAEERVAELARDLMEMEQKLLVEKEETAHLRAQNQAFGRTMASLQDSRDEAINEIKKLRLLLKEGHQSENSSAPPSSSTSEMWSLKNALSALQNDRERMIDQLQMQRRELDRLGSGELARLTEVLKEERNKTEETEKRFSVLLQERERQLERDRQELQMLRLEHSDLQAQAESLRKQTLATLSERDHQIRYLGAMLEEAKSLDPKLLQTHSHRQGSIAEDSAPGGPLGHSEDYKAECVLLQKRLDEEMELRLSVQERLSAAQDHLKQYTQGEWHSGAAWDVHSETAFLIEPAGGVVTRSRRGGPGLSRMLRGAYCSRQWTPLLASLYLLTVHALLLLCLGGYF